MVQTPHASPGRVMADEVIAGRYELEELVGTGGMSSVYKAHDRLLERHVALKLLHPHFGEDAEYVERFRREARSVAQLSHPHVVTVIDRGEADGQQFIVFEYVHGENLKELVTHTGKLPLRRAIELALQIAGALAFAHEHDLVHRDVKPQNVLLTPDGDAKVTDFGIARSLDVEQGVTQTGTVLGTSTYLSPEQASGRPVTPATDVYSLGVVLYELLTGEVPFPGENFVAVAMRHVNEPPPKLTEKRPDAPPRLVSAVDRALEKDPSRRFPTMNQFARELRRCLGELGSGDEGETAIVPRRMLAPRRTRPARATRRRRPVYVLAVLVAAAAIVWGVLALGGSKGKKPPGSTAGGAAVSLSGVGAYDPYGNNKVEHNSEAPDATDGDPATYWETEHYRGGLGKPGVGVVIDAGRAVSLQTVTVTSDTPGYSAEIEAGASQAGPFTPDSAAVRVGSHTTFRLNRRTARYYVVWITNLGANSSVHVNEVKARS